MQEQEKRRKAVEAYKVIAAQMKKKVMVLGGPDYEVSVWYRFYVVIYSFRHLLAVGLQTGSNIKVHTTIVRI